MNKDAEITKSTLKITLAKVKQIILILFTISSIELGVVYPLRIIAINKFPKHPNFKISFHLKTNCFRFETILSVNAKKSL